jgi:hypothetical protein
MVLLGAVALASFGQDTPRYRAIDVWVDAGDAALAAYQIEIVAEGEGTVTGVEGGEPAPFRAPPYYDPAALAGGRIILAAFTTADGAPTGRIRVARIHVMETGPVTYRAALLAAAAPGGRRISPRIETQPVKNVSDTVLPGGK